MTDHRRNVGRSIDRGACVPPSQGWRTLPRRYQDPPFKLMAERNSWQVSGCVLNVPNKQFVAIVVTPGLGTPLVVMHSCPASTITPTPCGFKTLLRQFAISAVVFS